LQKKETMTLIVIIGIILTMAIAVFSVGVLQNSRSEKDLATYTGYLVNDSSFSYPIRSFDHPSSISSNYFSLTFADGRTFIMDRTLVENRNVTTKTDYTVYYNVTNPEIAIDIVKTLDLYVSKLKR